MNLWQRITAGVSAGVKSFIDVVTGRTPESESEPQPEPEPQPDPRIEKLKAENRYVINQANAKYDELISQDLQNYSNAFEHAKNSGGRFDIEDLDSEVDILREVLRATEFINDPTSDVDMASYKKRIEFGKQTAEDANYFGYDIYNTRNQDNPDIIAKFWQAVDRVREEDNIGARLKAIEYDRDAVYGYAFGIWAESNFDQKVLRDTLEDFLQEQDRIHSKSYNATAGTASFERNEDTIYRPKEDARFDRREGDWL